MDECWRNLAEREEEVLDKYKVEDSRRRGSPLEWRRLRRSKKYKMRKRREDFWARIFAFFRGHNLQRLQCMHEDSTEEEEMKRQGRMNK